MKRTTIMIPDELKMRAIKYANRMGMSLGGFIRESVERALEPTDGGPSSETSDPLFADVAGDDFHLQPGSPCIDAGDPDPQYNDTDGSRNDIGAFGGPARRTRPAATTPAEPEAVLLGSAILGAVAAGAHDSVAAAMAAMSRSDEIIEPAGGAVARYHDAKHTVFHRMHEDLLAYRGLMSQPEKRG